MFTLFIIAAAAVLSQVLCFSFGYWFGKRNEREAWNELIENGTLPKPKK